MKVGDIYKATELLNEYVFFNNLMKKVDETHAIIAPLSDKIMQTNIEVEQFQYRKEIADNIQKVLSNSKHYGYNFEHNVLMFGFGTATKMLKCKLKELNRKIERL
jgi:hypothetical protein